MGDSDSGQFLNIYTMKGNGPDLNPDGLAFSCSVEINFIPYHLTHCVAANDVKFYHSTCGQMLEMFKL